VVKAFPSVWQDGLWYKLWHMGIKGKMFRVLYHLYDSMSRCAMQNTGTSPYFVGDVGLGEGDPLSPLLYTLFINGLLEELWEKHPGVPLPCNSQADSTSGQAASTSKVVALMLADDLVGLAESEEQIQLLAESVHAYSRKWRFKLSTTKSAVVVFGATGHGVPKPKVCFGIHELQVLDAYKYLGIVFASDCKWEAHIASMIEKALKSMNALSAFFSNRRITLEVKRGMLLALIRPTVEYGSEVWWASPKQADSIESKVQIEVLKRALHCRPNICHEIIRAEVGVRPLSSWFDQRKMEWWFKLLHKEDSSLCKQVLQSTWPSLRNYSSWQKHVDKLMAGFGMQDEAFMEQQKGEVLSHFRSHVKFCIYERDRAAREERAKSKSTLACYMQHYNEEIGCFKPQPYLCSKPLSKGMEIVMQLRAGILPLGSVTAKFGGSRQAASRGECKSCALDIGGVEGFGPGEAESPEHFMFTCPCYELERQELWERLNSVPSIAAKVIKLDAMQDQQQKLHSMLSEQFWGIEAKDGEHNVPGPFVHAFDCLARYVAAAWRIRNCIAHPPDVM
jgi:hypothetical protein